MAPLVEHQLSRRTQRCSVDDVRRRHDHPLAGLLNQRRRLAQTARQWGGVGGLHRRRMLPLLAWFDGAGRDRYIEPTFGQRHGDGLADAAAGAGYERCLSIAHVESLPLTLVGANLPTALARLGGR